MNGAAHKLRRRLEASTAEIAEAIGAMVAYLGPVSRPPGTAYDSPKIAWSPIRRQRTEGCLCPSTSTLHHSQVTRPSGPAKIQVISKTARAPAVAFRSSEYGHAPGPRCLRPCRIHRQRAVPPL